MPGYSECVQLLENNILRHALVPAKQQNLQDSSLEVFQPGVQEGDSQDRG